MHPQKEDTKQVTALGTRDSAPRWGGGPLGGSGEHVLLGGEGLWGCAPAEGRADSAASNPPGKVIGAGSWESSLSPAWKWWVLWRHR